MAITKKQTQLKASCLLNLISTNFILIKKEDVEGREMQRNTAHMWIGRWREGREGGGGDEKSKRWREKEKEIDPGLI